MNKKPPRYAHEEGQVGLCFDDNGEHIITCGSEGDVRIFAGFDDDDPLTHKVGDTVYAVAYKNYRFYTAADDNAVQVRIFKEGEPDGILTRCTAPVNTICFNKDGTKVVTGSSDFSVKIVNVDDSSQKIAAEHEAPVLCVTINPQETLLASSSCDGTVKVYSFNQEKVIHTITGLPKSNDLSTSNTLSRLAWDKAGKYLCVPVEKEVKLYNIDNWSVKATLTHEDVKQFMSIAVISPCGKYLATSTQDGLVLIYDMSTHKCVAKDQHQKKLGITGLAWKPKGETQLAWVDNHGNLGLYEDFLPSNQAESNDRLNVDQLQELFEDVDDDMLVEATNAQGQDASDDSDVEDIKPNMNRSRVTQIQDDDDDDSNDIYSTNIDDRADNASETSETPAVKPATVAPTAPAPVVVKGFEPTPLQKPFQSGSTPEHFAHRFMVWNSVGVVLQYNTDEENSINIEFHDTATHHALHVPNTLGHTMADLSTEAAVLACESDEDTPSKLVCMHYSSWDSCKEWSVPMPQGEEIEAVCLGDGWVAAITDHRIVRLFSVSGLQKEVFSIPGPVVAVSGHTHQLIVVYHKGMGVPGDQCLGVRLINVMGKKKTVIAGDDLPISRKSILVWLGFSAEGTPFTVDSVGIVRMLNRRMGNNWVQVANTRKKIKGKSDSYFIVGIHENPQQLRAILCKGSKYPPTLPRPNVNILPFEIPLCEMTTEKGTIEENYWRSMLLSQHFDWLSGQGFEIDDTAKAHSVMPQQEALMKLFALACKTEREFRAVEICDMMPSSHTVQLAIKYASRVRLTQLAGRLGEVARTKAEEELLAVEQGGEEEEEEMEEEEQHVQVHTNKQTWSAKPPQPQPQDDCDDDADMEEEEGDLYEQLDEEQQQEETPAPVLKLKTDKDKPVTPKSISLSQNTKKNPFKVASQKTPSTGQGSRVFDSIETKPKSASKMFSVQKSPDPLAKRPRINKKANDQKKNSSVAKMFGKSEPVQKESLQTPSKSGFQLWFEENKSDLQDEHPDLDDTDLTKVAAKAFKELPSDDKKMWNEKTKSSVTEDDCKKRKRDDDGENQENEDLQNKIAKKDQILENKKPLSQNASSKLAAFSFNKT